MDCTCRGSCVRAECEKECRHGADDHPLPLAARLIAPFDGGCRGQIKRWGCRLRSPRVNRISNSASRQFFGPSIPPTGLPPTFGVDLNTIPPSDFPLPRCVRVRAYPTTPRKSIDWCSFALRRHSGGYGQRPGENRLGFGSVVVAHGAASSRSRHVNNQRPGENRPTDSIGPPWSPVGLPPVLPPTPCRLCPVIVVGGK